MTVGLSGGDLRAEYGASAPPKSRPRIAEDSGLQFSRRLHPMGDGRIVACRAVDGHRGNSSACQISEGGLAADSQFGKRRTQRHSGERDWPTGTTGGRSSSRSTAHGPSLLDESNRQFAVYVHEAEIACGVPAGKWRRRYRDDTAIHPRSGATDAIEPADPSASAIPEDPDFGYWPPAPVDEPETADRASRTMQPETSETTTLLELKHSFDSDDAEMTRQLILAPARPDAIEPADLSDQQPRRTPISATGRRLLSLSRTQRCRRRRPQSQRPAQCSR